MALLHLILVHFTFLNLFAACDCNACCFSSPEDNHQRTPGAENIHGQAPAQGLSFVENNPAGEMEEQAQSHTKVGDKSVALENNDVQRYSPDLLGEKKVSDNSEGQAASSSDSGSDSDSDSDSSDSGSDSGSHSRSRSRSKSPVGSGSGSSSDSESDSSSNSKEASDEDVDILSDDDKEYKQKLQASEPGLSPSPVPWKTNDGRPMQNEIDEKQDDEVDIEDHGSDAVDIEGLGSDVVDIEGHGSDAVDIEGHGSDAVEKDLPDDRLEIDMAVNNSLVPSKDSENPIQGKKDLTDHGELGECQTFIGNLFDDKGTSVKDSFKHERSKSNPPERTSINKSKRGPDFKHVDEISEHDKRSKVERTQLPISGGRDTQLLESPHHLSPNRSFEDPYRGLTTQMTNRTDREGNADFGFQKGYNQEFPGKYNSDFQQSGRKSSDQNVRSKARDTAERLNRHGRKITEKSFQVLDGSPIAKEKTFRDNQNEDGFAKEKKGPRNLKEGGAEAKNSGPFDSSNGKHGEMVEKINETGQFSSSHIGNGRASVLQRELSDLELGELREPLPNEVPMKKQFDRKGSFKQLENKSSASDNYNSDLSKGKLIGKATSDSGKTSPSNLRVGMKRTPEHHVEESTRTNHRVDQPPSHYHSRDHTEVGTQFNKSIDASSKSRRTEAGTRLAGGLDVSGESHKKAPTNALQQHGSKRGVASQSAKKNKSQKTSKTIADSVDGRKDTILTEGNDSGRKRRESSSDEDTSSYYKYEKDEPDLKGPIKDFSQ